MLSCIHHQARGLGLGRRKEVDLQMLHTKCTFDDSILLSTATVKILDLVCPCSLSRSGRCCLSLLASQLIYRVTLQGDVHTKQRLSEIRDD